jgi:hypothetical protein
VYILAPLPVTLGDEDESYADDLPAGVVYVHLPDASRPPAHVGGLVAVQGRLALGAQAEPDGRLSFVRLYVDPVSPTTPEPPHDPAR